MKRRTKMIWIIVIVLFFILALIISCNVIIVNATRARCHDKVSNVPENKVGLVLGTSPVLGNGNSNLYFNNRVNAAAGLYKAGKVQYLLVSGDNRRVDYNEPLEMKNRLMQQGVPEKVIYLDYAGLRTLDSVVRAKEIFGQQSITVISQKFHNERALYIAGKHGVNAVGYNAEDVPAYSGIKTRIRESLARVKVFIDLLTNKQPRHMGERIPIP